MSNPTREDAGLNDVVEEIACLAPDINEAIGRLDEIETLLHKDLRDAWAALTAFKAAILSLQGHIKLMRDELHSDRAEVDRRLQAIQEGAEKMGYPFLVLPKLRVVAKLPE